MLDAVADRLEAQGFVKEAFEVDKVADVLEASEKQEWSGLKTNIKGIPNNDVPEDIKGIINSIGFGTEITQAAKSMNLLKIQISGEYLDSDHIKRMLAKNLQSIEVDNGQLQINFKQ